jgi:hypothetical protein
MFRLSQEFAGLGGNIGFFKNEVEIQVCILFYIVLVPVGTGAGGYRCRLFV